MHDICVKIQQIQGDHLPDQVAGKIGRSITDPLTPQADLYFLFNFVHLFYLRISFWHYCTLFPFFFQL